MNHKYSTFVLLGLFVFAASFIVLGELVSDEISYGLCPDANINDGEVWLIVGYNNVWNCTRFDNSVFNISVNNVTVYVNSTNYWGDYYFEDYNLTNLGLWTLGPGNNISTIHPLILNQSLTINNWSRVKRDLLVDRRFSNLGYTYLENNTFISGDLQVSNFDHCESSIFEGSDILCGTPSPSRTSTYVKGSSIYFTNSVLGGGTGIPPVATMNNIFGEDTIDGFKHNSTFNFSVYQGYITDTDFLYGPAFELLATPDNNNTHIWINGSIESTKNITAQTYYGDGSHLTGITIPAGYNPNNDTIVNTTNGLSVNTTKYLLWTNASKTARLDATVNISTDYMYIGDAQSSLVSTSTGASSDKVVIYKNNPGATSRALLVLMNFNSSSNANLPTSGLNSFVWHNGDGSSTRIADFGGFAAGRYLAILNGNGGVSRGGGVSAKGLDNRGSTFRSSGFSYDYNAEGCVVSTQNITTCVNYDYTPHQDTSTGVIQNAIGAYVREQTVGTVTNKEIFLENGGGVFFRNLNDENLYISSPENNNLTIHASDTTNIDSILRLTPRSSAPTGNLGDIYVDSDSNELCFYDGSSWTGLKAGGACA